MIIMQARKHKNDGEIMESTIVIAIGYSEDRKNAATVISCDSGPLESIVSDCGALEVAENLGLFSRERNGSAMLRKHKNGVYRVVVDIYGDELNVKFIESIMA